jgi:hypothetical protein
VAQVRAGADSIIAKPLIFHWFLVGFSKIVDFPLVFDRFWRMVAAGRVEPGPGQIPVRGAFSCHCQMAARHHEIVDYSLVSDPLSQHNGPRAAFPPCLPRAPRPSSILLRKTSAPRPSSARSPSRVTGKPSKTIGFSWFFRTGKAPKTLRFPLLVTPSIWRIYIYAKWPFSAPKLGFRPLFFHCF